MKGRTNVYAFRERPRFKAPQSRASREAVLPAVEPEKIVEVKVRRRYVTGRIETEEGRLKGKAVKAKRAKPAEPAKKARAKKVQAPAEPKKKGKKKGA